MRFLAILALAVTVAAAAQAPAPAIRPLVSEKGPPAIPGPPLGLVWNLAGRDVVLARLDPATLAPGRPRLPIGRSVSTWGYDPVDRWLAIGRNGTTLRLVDTERMRMLGDVRIGGRIDYLEWLFPNRFLAVTSGPSGTSLAWVDAERRRVFQRGELDTQPWAVASGGSVAVALLPPHTPKIGGARLAVAGGDGRVRIVSVPRIKIGFSRPAAADRVAQRVSPGLAVTSAGERAYLVGGAGTVAVIDLHSLAVSYHSPHGARSFLSRLGDWLVPAAQAKGLDGPWLQAAWLGDGLIAVSGSQYHLQQKPYRQLISPVGLRVIDTRTWTQRTLDDRATGFVRAGDTLLAYGLRTTWRDGEVAADGMGVVAYGPDGAKRFEALTDEAITAVAVAGGRAYAWRLDRGAAGEVAVVDLETGTVQGNAVLEHPTRLLAPVPGS